MSFSCEFVERRTYNNRSAYKTRTEKNKTKKWSRYYLAEEGTEWEGGGGFGRFNRTTQQSDPVMRSAALVGKCPREKRKTNLHIDFCHQGRTGAMSGLTGEEGISRTIYIQQSSLKKKDTRLVNRGRNDTVVCLVVFFSRQCGIARRYTFRLDGIKDKQKKKGKDSFGGV